MRVWSWRHVWLSLALASCAGTKGRARQLEPLVCGQEGSPAIREVRAPAPAWTVPVRSPGPIARFDDVRGTVFTMPLRPNDQGIAVAHRIIVERVRYVKNAAGELAVAEIKGQRDDGTPLDVKGLASGQPIAHVEELRGARIFIHDAYERGMFTIESIELRTREDGMLVIGPGVLVDERGQRYAIAVDIDCPTTLVNVCACPNFLGYCDDDNYPDCANEKCNFGNATCQARQEVACATTLCARDLLPGFCAYLPGTSSCICIVPKTPDEMRAR
jgi:hypothetical protein